MLIRALLVAAGSLFVAIGVIGIFLPLLPSTVFFLIAAACYGRSSPTAYNWLTTNRYFGAHLRNYREHRGVTLRGKVIAVSSIWVGIGISAYLLGFQLVVTLILLAVAICVSTYLIRLHTVR